MIRKVIWKNIDAQQKVVKKNLIWHILVKSFVRSVGQGNVDEKKEWRRKTMDEYQMMEYIRDEARLHKVSLASVFQVWKETYEYHKIKFGSFKNIDNYHTRMNERYNECGTACLDYIIEHIKKKWDRQKIDEVQYAIRYFHLGTNW